MSTGNICKNFMRFTVQNNVIRCLSSNKNAQLLKLNSAIKEAENFVGFSTHKVIFEKFLNQNSIKELSKNVIVNDQNTTFINFIKTSFIENHEQSICGLCTLLVSQAAGLKKTISESEIDKTYGLLSSQRDIAELAEMFRVCIKIHQTVQNFDSSDNYKENITTFNKLVLLGGDYLLSECNNKLAMLRNQNLNELMTSAMKDLIESNFIGPRDYQNRPIPVKQFKLLDENLLLGEFFNDSSIMPSVLEKTKVNWTIRNLFSHALLLGKSCQSALNLAGHDSVALKQAFNFGKNFSLAWNAHLEIVNICDAKFEPSVFVSAPVLFHLKHNPILYEEIERGINNVDNINYNAVREAVLNGPGLEETKKLQMEHLEIASELLGNFPNRDARKYLENIITSLKEVYLF